MKTLYFELSMGAAGDMLAAALFQLVPDPERLLARINGLGLPGVAARLLPAEKCGIQGLRYQVLVHSREEGQQERHEHHGHHLHDMEAVLAAADLPEAVREDALAVYRLLARAESRVHGRPVEEIHFHEVGQLDALVDILTVCLLMYELSPELVCASAVHVGSGTVRCAHGILPVPAPATAELLKGIPCYTGEIRGELCTPTGAALLRHFVKDFGPMPEMRVERTGCGMGTRDFPQANCLRVSLGESGESVVELCCSVDDMSGEAVGYALERLREAGALDAFWQSVGMKKSRPGLLLTVLCQPEDRERIVELLFRLTSTLGIRESLCRRYILRREKGHVETPYGPVGVKKARGYGVERSKTEYEDLKSLAEAAGCSLDEARKLAEDYIPR